MDFRGRKLRDVGGGLTNDTERVLVDATPTEINLMLQDLRAELGRFVAIDDAQVPGYTELLIVALDLHSSPRVYRDTLRQAIKAVMAAMLVRGTRVNQEFAGT